MRRALCFIHPHGFLGGRGFKSLLQVTKLKPRGEEGLTLCHTTMPSADEEVSQKQGSGGTAGFRFRPPTSPVALAPP